MRYIIVIFLIWRIGLPHESRHIQTRARKHSHLAFIRLEGGGRISIAL
jgi:hypothetical protein